jgi:hypothetical protein
MAEQLDLSINIGANTQDFQGALQKAQNLLGQFQAALKKATNVGEINYLNNQIANLNKTIAGINTQMNNVGRPASDATNALSNLSRVAQDAPYGFMGIANNLNPLLESFQRLQKESGGSTNALKSLASGLIGPAGIGLALGVVSSVIVKFGDDIQKFITEKAVGLGKAFTKETEIISTGVEAFVKARLEIVELNNEFTNYTNGITTKESFLKKFNDTLGDTIKETKDLATAEKFLTDYADDYVQMTFKKAIANEAAAQAAKKQVEAEIARAKPSEAFKEVADFTTIFFGGNMASIDKVAKNRQNTIATNAENEVSLLETIRNKYQTKANEIQGELAKIFGTPEVKGGKKNNSFANDVAEQRKILDKEFNRIKETFGTKKDEQYLNAFVSPKAKTPERLQEGMSTFYKDAQEDNAIRTESILLTKQQTEANLQLADSLSNYAANSFMNLWASMEQGMSIGEALGNVFIDLTKQIAAAAIKAAVFQGIVALFSGGTSVAAKTATGGFGSMFKGLLGLASGGVVTGPTLAMIGEGAESEAVMPLSKLGNLMQSTFNAGSMASNGGGGNGEFVLRGTDLVLAMNRSETSLKYRRG